MTDFLFHLLRMSLAATWVALSVLVLRLFLRKLPKWLTVLLWALVALRLVCPTTITSSFSQIPEPVSSGQLLTQFSQGYVGNIEIIHSNQPAYSEAVQAGRTPIPAGEDAYYVVTAPDKRSAPDTVGTTLFPLLFWVWLTGVCGMLLHLLLSYSALLSRLRTAVWVQEGIYRSDAIASPFVFGVFRPRIYLPFSLEDSALPHVLAHERCHIRRRDPLWKMLGFFLLSLHWFNPVLWPSYHLLCQDIELACDEQVVRSLSMVQRAEYSQALLSCSLRSPSVSACPLAFGEVGVRKRIRSVLSYRKPALWVILLAVLLAVVISACFLTDPAPTPTALTDTLQVLESDTLSPVWATLWEQEGILTQLSDSQTDELLSLLHALSASDFAESPALESKLLLTLSFGQQRLSLSTDFESATFTVTPSIPSDGVLWGTRDSRLLSFLRQLSAEPANGGVRLNVTSVSPTGATLVFLQDTAFSAHTLFGGSDYFLQQLLDGVWVDLPTRQDPVFTTEAYQLTNLCRHVIQWEWLYGALPDGHYRIGKSIQILTGNGASTPQHGLVYGEFDLPGTTVTSAADVSPLYTLIRSLPSEGTHCHAEFHVGGGGYGFFPNQCTQLVSLLHDLPQDDFFLSPGVTPHTTITLSYDDQQLSLRYDGDTVEFLCNSISGIDGTLWAVQNGELNAFFADLNQYSASRSTYEIYNVAPLESLSDHYTLEEAEIDRVVILIDNDILCNASVWHQFLQDCDTGLTSTVRLLHVFHDGERTFYDLTCQGSTYQLRWFADSQEHTSTYAYLRHFAGPDEGSENSWDAYDCYVLTDDAYSDWQTLRSRSDCFVAYEDRIFYPDHPTLPAALTQATLELDGQTLLTLSDADTLSALQAMFASAEWMSEPKTYSFGPVLVLTGSDGSAVQIELGLDSDLCRIDGQFYDYGPGFSDVGAIDALPQLFALLGLSNWPQPVLDAYADYFGFA